MTPTMSNKARDERGFSLIEALVSIGVLSVGLLAMASAFASGMQMMMGSNMDFVAREKAAEAIESVFTARDTHTITWAMIHNVIGESGADGGVFLDGPQGLKLTGTDGLVNTDDDSDTLESIPQPGADGLLGTGDDSQMELTSFTREVEIRDLGPTLRRLRVIIRYEVGAQTREYIIVTYISSYV
jgi:type II secretory pathway pseudopilin PulG